MYFNLPNETIEMLLLLPETGMGYQIIEANKFGSYESTAFLVLNAELALDIDNELPYYLQTIKSKGIEIIKQSSSSIHLNNIILIPNSSTNSVVLDTINSLEKGALDNDEMNADGEEHFVRLSPFKNDRRIDRINECLLPGSFATTELDFINNCLTCGQNPIERYALPSDEKIKHGFIIVPLKTDKLQKGKVQSANGRIGGGIEAYFKNGTSKGTFKYEMNL